MSEIPKGKYKLGPMPNQSGPIEENPIIETITFTVAFRRRHKYRSRFELVPDALSEYAQSVRNQVTMKTLKEESLWGDSVNTFKDRTNAFESEDGVLVWWDSERESKGKYVVMATRNEIPPEIVNQRRNDESLNIWESIECNSFEEAARIRERALINGADRVMIVEQCPIVYKDGRYHP